MSSIYNSNIEKTVSRKTNWYHGSLHLPTQTHEKRSTKEREREKVRMLVVGMRVNPKISVFPFEVSHPPLQALVLPRQLRHLFGLLRSRLLRVGGVGGDNETHAGYVDKHLYKEMARVTFKMFSK